MSKNISSHQKRIMEHLQRYITSINLQERNKNEKSRGAFRCYNLWDSLQQGWRLKHCSMPVAPHQWLRSVDTRAVPLSLKWNSTNCQSTLMLLIHLAKILESYTDSWNIPPRSFFLHFLCSSCPVSQSASPPRLILLSFLFISHRHLF